MALAGRTCDQVTELIEAINAYLALECFVQPEYADEAQARVQPSRALLTSLLRAINLEVQRRLAALAEITALLQAQVTIDAAHPR
ncbi:hypothetical protein [Hydrogenophaga sp.]|uniref:hypothetical protein n=1 Tax=Hydrogenophaga sp. TaxID=1904254 RepID=UPI0027284554|nr:hypothetical protein [Hydrogenophaga sp.]MDO9434937.1 hypothetical protein [Hydrogenophaga sp.]